MSEHTDLLPLRSPEEGGPAFELVRRGYDRDQVENHLGWLEDQLRNAEIARDAAEHAAATAAAEAEAAREALELGRPQWNELGERITQILTLAEEQGTEIRLQRTREADELLADARQAAIDADRTHGQRIREAESQAQQIVADAQSESHRMMSEAQVESERVLTEAQTEAERLITRVQKQAADEEGASGRRLAELERQRDAVNAQLSRLHEALSRALTPALSIHEAAQPPVAAQVSLPADTGYEQAEYADPEYAATEYEQPGYEDDEYATSSARAARTAAEARGRST